MSILELPRERVKRYTFEVWGKVPLVSWKEFEKRTPRKEEVGQWFRKFRKFNVAIVTGSVSSNSGRHRL